MVLGVDVLRLSRENRTKKINFFFRHRYRLSFYLSMHTLKISVVTNKKTLLLFYSVFTPSIKVS